MNLQFPILTYDAKNFRQLYGETFAGVFSYCKSLGLIHEDAQDVTVETYAALWRLQPVFNTEKEFRKYLILIIRSKCRNLTKQKINYKDVPDIAEEEIVTIEPAIKERLLQLIDYIPASCRDILKMRYYDELPYTEIAKKKNISVNSARTNVQYALKLLRRYKKEFIDDPILIPDKQIVILESTSKATTKDDEGLKEFIIINHEYYTIGDIAQELRINKYAVQKAYKELGIKPCYKLEILANNIKEHPELSIKHLAEKYGYHHGHLRKIMKQLGLPTKNRTS